MSGIAPCFLVYTTRYWLQLPANVLFLPLDYKVVFCFDLTPHPGQRRGNRFLTPKLIEIASSTTDELMNKTFDQVSTLR